MANTYSHLKMGDWVWSPGGENEWCLVVVVTSDAVWKYARPSTQTIITAGANVSALKPDYIRNSDHTPSRPG
jgi:hypothetical protein